MSPWSRAPALRAANAALTPRPPAPPRPRRPGVAWCLAAWCFAVAFTVALAALPSCASLWSAAKPVGEAALHIAIDSAIKAAEEEAGRRLGDVPTACEVEHHPEDGKVLVLCTVCYRLAPGETCR